MQSKIEIVDYTSIFERFSKQFKIIYFVNPKQKECDELSCPLEELREFVENKGWLNISYSIPIRHPDGTPDFEYADERILFEDWISDCMQESHVYKFLEYKLNINGSQRLINETAGELLIIEKTLIKIRSILNDSACGFKEDFKNKFKKTMVMNFNNFKNSFKKQAKKNLATINNQIY